MGASAGYEGIRIQNRLPARHFQWLSQRCRCGRNDVSRRRSVRSRLHRCGRSAPQEKVECNFATPPRSRFLSQMSRYARRKGWRKLAKAGSRDVLCKVEGCRKLSKKGSSRCAEHALESLEAAKQHPKEKRPNP